MIVNPSAFFQRLNRRSCPRLTRLTRLRQDAPCGSTGSFTSLRASSESTEFFISKAAWGRIERSGKGRATGYEITSTLHGMSTYSTSLTFRILLVLSLIRAHSSILWPTTQTILSPEISKGIFDLSNLGIL